MNTSFKTLGAAFSLLLSSTVGSLAATFTHDGTSIRLEGTIERGDSDRLQNLISATGISSIQLNSNGGNALEGYNLGYTLRLNNMQTIVQAWASCMSACATAFLGGTSYTLDGIVGFHVAWSPDDTQTYSDGMKSGQFLGSIDSVYHFNMGFTAQLQYIIAQVTDSETFLVLDLEDIETFKMVDGDYTYFIDLPNKWMYERVADPLRLYLLKGGH